MHNLRQVIDLLKQNGTVFNKNGTLDKEKLKSILFLAGDGTLNYKVFFATLGAIFDFNKLSDVTALTRKNMIDWLITTPHEQIKAALHLPNDYEFPFDKLTDKIRKTKQLSGLRLSLIHQVLFNYREKKCFGDEVSFRLGTHYDILKDVLNVYTCPHAKTNEMLFLNVNTLTDIRYNASDFGEYYQQSLSTLPSVKQQINEIPKRQPLTAPITMNATLFSPQYPSNEEINQVLMDLNLLRNVPFDTNSFFIDEEDDEASHPKKQKT